VTSVRSRNCLLTIGSHFRSDRKIRALHAPHYTSFSVMFAYEQTEIRDQSVFTPDGATHYLEWDETLLRLTFEGQK